MTCRKHAKRAPATNEADVQTNCYEVLPEVSDVGKIGEGHRHTSCDPEGVRHRTRGQAIARMWGVTMGVAFSSLLGNGDK
jgi:hypothetical protein